LTFGDGLSSATLLLLFDHLTDSPGAIAATANASLPGVATDGRPRLCVLAQPPRVTVIVDLSGLVRLDLSAVAAAGHVCGLYAIAAAKATAD
jgi:hypothetical protein